MCPHTTSLTPPLVIEEKIVSRKVSIFITRFTDWMYLFCLFYIKIKHPQIWDKGLQFDLFVGWDSLSDNITTSLTVDHSGYRVCRLSCFLPIKDTFLKSKKRCRHIVADTKVYIYRPTQHYPISI